MWRPATQPARLPGRSELTPSLLSFDVYGTLVDVRGGSREAFATILRETGASRIDALEFWEHWEAANIRGHWQAPRPHPGSSPAADLPIGAGGPPRAAGGGTGEHTAR